jgi:glutamate/tyrosine decarboxylase-like PLP-dependent enzyme
VAELVERHCRQARRLADGLAAAGFEVLNRVALNQVAGATGERRGDRGPAPGGGGERPHLVRPDGLVWQDRAALRLSVSSWRTRDEDVDETIRLLAALRERNLGDLDLSIEPVI